MRNLQVSVENWPHPKCKRNWDQCFSPEYLALCRMLKDTESLGNFLQQNIRKLQANIFSHLMSAHSLCFKKAVHHKMK